MKTTTKKKKIDKIREETENALLQRALGFHHEEVYIEDMIDKQSGEILETAKRKIVKKHTPPDVRALLFWLKNRYPESWRDRINLPEEMEDFDFGDAEESL